MNQDHSGLECLDHKSSNKLRIPVEPGQRTKASKLGHSGGDIICASTHEGALHRRNHGAQDGIERQCKDAGNKGASLTRAKDDAADETS